jgi:hypothetical protein
MRAYKSLEGKYGITSCNTTLKNEERNAVALWWNNKPFNTWQTNQTDILLNKLEELDCSEYLILRICEDEEPESIGCFHDHPFKVKQVITFEVTDAY